MYTSTRADINQVIRTADGIFIVLHHDHGITQIAQVEQGFEQTVVVALVQTNRRLIKDVHHPHQTGADL